MKRLSLVILLSCLGFSQNTPAPRSVDKATLERGVGRAEQALKAYQRTLGKYADLSTVAAAAEKDAEPILAAGKGVTLIRSRLAGHSATVDPSEITALCANIDAAASNAALTAGSLATEAFSGKQRLRNLAAANALTENARQLRQSSDELGKAGPIYLQGREPRPVIIRPGNSVGPSATLQPGPATICPAWGCSMPNFPVYTISAVSISPTSAALLAGGTQQFTGTVNGGANTAVTWSATAGTVSSSGLYTAPGTAGTYTVSATSVANKTESAAATVNVTTSASSTVFLGNPNVESQAGAIPLGQAEAFQATAGASGNLQSLVIYLDSTSTVSQLVAGLYADASGHPGALLNQGSSTQLQPGAWNPISLPATSVVAGTPYWIAILGTASGTLAFRDFNGGCAAETSAETSLTSLPPAWTTGAPSSACPASVFGDSTKVVFFDDFSGTALSPYWTVISRHGEYSQSETECNVPSMVSVNNGLSITTEAQGASCGDYFNAPSPWPYTTGDIQWTNLNFTYGTIEIRAKFPSVNTSLWPATWLLGSNCQYTNPLTGSTGVTIDGHNCPDLGASGYTEIDMTECYGSGGWCQFHVANPNFGIGNGCDAVYSVDTNYHTFDTVWNSSGITQSMDGAAETNCNQQLSNPMFLLIQTQTGGVGGTPNNAHLPATLMVESVKVTQP